VRWTAEVMLASIWHSMGGVRWARASAALMGELCWGVLVLLSSLFGLVLEGAEWTACEFTPSPGLSLGERGFVLGGLWLREALRCLLCA
jgi:hypothetical protein